MHVLAFATVVITGFTACAEFGSYAFVHPVIRDLPPEHHFRVEQGLLRTFGRVMPVLMTLCVLCRSLMRSNSPPRLAQPGSFAGHRLLRSSSPSAQPSSSMCQLIATGRWSAEKPPENWKETRNRWEFFQGLRSWLLLIGFVLLCLAISL